MKIAMAAVMLAATAFLDVAHAQIIALPGSTNSWLLHESPNLSLNQPWTHPSTNVLPFLSLTNGSATLPEISSPVKQIKPGAYESFPYTCIVIVPGATGDNCNDGQVGPYSMPTEVPGTTLVPLSEAEK